MEFCESDGEVESELKGDSTTVKNMEDKISRGNVESVINHELKK